MDNIIYLACIKLDKISGGYDLDPCIDPASPNKVQILANKDLVALQIENSDALRTLNMIGNLVLVPVKEDVYNELTEELESLLKNVSKNIDEAVARMADAYKIMNIDANVSEIREQMMAELTNYGSSGKVLNENLEIVERADNYVVYDEDDDYEDDYEDEYEDDEEYDDDYYED